MMLRHLLIFIFGVALAGRCAGVELTILGVVYKDEPVSLDLTFTNAGPSPVVFKTITASCDCLTVLSKPSTVAPGVTVKIPCRYRAGKTGRIAVDVVVEGAASSMPLATYFVSGFVADPTWLISPSEVSRRLDELSLVDTRPTARFAGVHIPRALNIPAFALKTRTELRGRKMVLVDDGFEPAVLLEEAAGLRAQGFTHVFVLDGGMAAWLRQGHAGEGTATAIKALAVTEITPAEFLRARSEGIWQGVDVGAETASRMPNLFPAGLVRAKGAEEIGAALGALPAVHAGQEARILVIPSETAKPGEIEAHLPKAAGASVYYLKGGLVALAAYQAEQTALAANTGQTFQSKAARRTPIVSGACGSCGK